MGSHQKGQHIHVMTHNYSEVITTLLRKTTAKMKPSLPFYLRHTCKVS